jgi:hypothetical protein
MPNGFLRHENPVLLRKVNMFSEKQDPIKKMRELMSAKGLGSMANSVFSLFFKISEDMAAN